MKKLFIYISFFSIACFGLTACDKNLDVTPRDIIYDEDIFSSESGVAAFMATMYYEMPVEDFRYTANKDFNQAPQPNGWLADLTDEAGTTDLRATTDIFVASGWNYTSVNHVNSFIERIATADFPESKKKIWLGEAKFIRAYNYYAMVKRYGGVPIITQVQKVTGDNLAELQVPRNSEKEVYDFIAKELDEAAELLEESSGRSRANKYVAYALKSRAMLYAAATARYGTVQLNGLLGFPATDADTYWQAAYDAAKKVIDSKKYSLYAKNADKAKNYQELFLDISSPESILIKEYSYPSLTHSYDNYILPHRLLGGFGSAIGPSLEMVEAYEYIDGTPGTLKMKDALGNDIQYNNPVDIFKDKDPRFFGTILYPFSEWRGNVIDVRAGIIEAGTTRTSNNYNDLYKGIHIIGWHGIGGSRELSQTGFYLQKYLNPAYDPSTVKLETSSQHYIDMRYAEVLLNYAEAAAELEKPGDANTALNLIRERAGIKLLTEADITVEKVRHERQVELAFENQRWWDIRRWRIATVVLNNKQLLGIMPYLNLPGNTYTFKSKALPATTKRTFPARRYYERIPVAQIETNPRIIPNPGY
jgi:hypothetical protein